MCALCDGEPCKQNIAQTMCVEQELAIHKRVTIAFGAKKLIEGSFIRFKKVLISQLEGLIERRVFS